MYSFWILILIVHSIVFFHFQSLLLYNISNPFQLSDQLLVHPNPINKAIHLTIRLIPHPIRLPTATLSTPPPPTSYPPSNPQTSPPKNWIPSSHLWYPSPCQVRRDPNRRRWRESFYPLSFRQKQMSYCIWEESREHVVLLWRGGLLDYALFGFLGKLISCLFCKLLMCSRYVCVFCNADFWDEQREEETIRFFARQSKRDRQSIKRRRWTSNAMICNAFGTLNPNENTGASPTATHSSQITHPTAMDTSQITHCTRAGM